MDAQIIRRSSFVQQMTDLGHAHVNSETQKACRAQGVRASLSRREAQIISNPVPRNPRSRRLSEGEVSAKYRHLGSGIGISSRALIVLHRHSPSKARSNFHLRSTDKELQLGDLAR